MSSSKNKTVIAITGASGAIYAQLLLQQLQKLNSSIEELSIVMSDNAKQVWEFELGNTTYADFPYTIYSKSDFTAPFASGSALYNKMIIIPCSMGTIGRIANGISNDLITRAADVILKERRQLILVARETPFNLIHLENMKQITLAGGIICPAVPSFYSKPTSINDIAMTVVNRVIDLMEIENKSYRWGK